MIRKELLRYYPRTMLYVAVVTTISVALEVARAFGWIA